MVQAVISFKNGGVAFILAFFLGLFFFNGVGHMYIGKVRRGVGIMILGWIIYSMLFIFLVSSFVPVFIQNYNSNNNDLFSSGSDFSQSFFSISLFGAIYFVYLIIQAADANRMAKKFNKHLDKTGELLWY
jgi:TM2 domain-containing membrane protein YozV